MFIRYFFQLQRCRNLLYSEMFINQFLLKMRNQWNELLLRKVIYLLFSGIENVCLSFKICDFI